MKFGLDEVARALGSEGPAGQWVTGWSVDSRTLAAGDLFFALRGPNHDGHDYVAAALEKGAAAVVVERRVGDAGTQILTPDTQEALIRVAGWARERWGGEVIGITGSAGKTTTKDVVAALLGVGVRTGKTVGNFNNFVGVPLSLLRLPGDARVAVIEMGMNHAGEIRQLAALARPSAGIVTNVGYAHIENFESIEGIAAAKRELIESLPADGVAILNADDARVATFRDVHPGRTITFGIGQAADVRAEAVEFLEDGSRFRVQGVEFETRLIGRHNVLNILAGIAAAGLYEIQPDRLREAVAALARPKMRGEQFTFQGVLVYNDCYNSNPDAVRSMLDVLRDAPGRRKIAVLGEMLELGHWAEALHREVGNYAAMSGVQLLVGIRGAACHILDAAKGAGHAVDAAYFFEQPEQAGEFLRGVVQPGDAILFKGSRGTRVEKALERFLA
ncbi:MAG: UDP-N-acetylmuramoyl-tripeptide--D-alanyl-D-alanine ligase [Bryobacteraceae bacterium]|nr:UDP-N-acetylmuramoyl-tripeptide--D-alanyl-D-alanine ligase [Bryobacteraceae bacterium]